MTIAVAASVITLAFCAADNANHYMLFDAQDLVNPIYLIDSPPEDAYRSVDPVVTLQCDCTPHSYVVLAYTAEGDPSEYSPESEVILCTGTHGFDTNNDGIIGVLHDFACFGRAFGSTTLIPPPDCAP